MSSRQDFSFSSSSSDSEGQPAHSLQHQQQQTEKRLQELVNFLKDIEKFLLRLEAEALSSDAEETRKSIFDRIYYYKKLGKSLSTQPRRKSRHDETASYSDRQLPQLPHQLPPPTKAFNRPKELKINVPDAGGGRGASGHPPRKIYPPTPFKPDITSTPVKSGKKEVEQPSSEDSDYQGEYEDVEPPPTPDGSSHYSQLDSSGSKEEESKEEDLPAPKLASKAEHSGYIWRKENFLNLGRTRFWGIVYRTRLYLYKSPQEPYKSDVLLLEDTIIKRANNKFAITYPSAGKNKKVKHEFYTENEEKAEEWEAKLRMSVPEEKKAAQQQIQNEDPDSFDDSSEDNYDLPNPRPVLSGRSLSSSQLGPPSSGESGVYVDPTANAGPPVLSLPPKGRRPPSPQILPPKKATADDSNNRQQHNSFGQSSRQQQHNLHQQNSFKQTSRQQQNSYEQTSRQQRNISEQTSSQQQNSSEQTSRQQQNSSEQNIRYERDIGNVKRGLFTGDIGGEEPNTSMSLDTSGQSSISSRRESGSHGRSFDVGLTGVDISDQDLNTSTQSGHGQEIKKMNTSSRWIESANTRPSESNLIEDHGGKGSTAARSWLHSASHQPNDTSMNKESGGKDTAAGRSWLHSANSQSNDLKERLGPRFNSSTDSQDSAGTGSGQARHAAGHLPNHVTQPSKEAAVRKMSLQRQEVITKLEGLLKGPEPGPKPIVPKKPVGLPFKKPAVGSTNAQGSESSKTGLNTSREGNNSSGLWRRPSESASDAKGAGASGPVPIYSSVIKTRNRSSLEEGDKSNFISHFTKNHHSSDSSEYPEYDTPEPDYQRWSYQSADRESWPAPPGDLLGNSSAPALHTAFACRLLSVGPDPDTAGGGGGRWR